MKCLPSFKALLNLSWHHSSYNHLLQVSFFFMLGFYLTTVLNPFFEIRNLFRTIFILTDCLFESLNTSHFFTFNFQTFKCFMLLLLQDCLKFISEHYWSWRNYFDFVEWKFVLNDLVIFILNFQFIFELFVFMNGVRFDFSEEKSFVFKSNLLAYS